jgi:hypothetical protein
MLTGAGGTVPYSYLWSSGQTTSAVTDLVAGNYTVTLQDANACAASQTLSITEPASVLTNSLAVTPPVCGNSDGTVVSVPGGGTSPYTYSWNTGSSSSSVTGLTGAPTETFIVTVTDMNGCVSKDTAYVSCVTAVADNLTPGQIKIFPNPADRWLQVERDGTEDLYLEMYSMVGEKLYSATDGSAQVRIDLSNIEPGIYFLHIISGKGTVVTKVVVSR